METVGNHPDLASARVAQTLLASELLLLYPIVLIFSSVRYECCECGRDRV